MQLCEQQASSTYGAARCGSYNGGCQGASKHYCYPYHVWSGVRATEGVYYLAELVGGTLTMAGSCGSGRCPSGYTGAVRCVLDLQIKQVQPSGLQLCEHGASSSYGAAHCSPLVSGCQGSYDTNCNPHAIWLTSTGGVKYHAMLHGGNLGRSSSHPVTSAFSVRCVLGLKCTDKLIADYSTSLPYGAAQCYWLAGGCQGTGIGTPYVNNCYPYAVWSSTAVEPIGHYRGYEMNGGSFFYSSGTCGAGVYGKCGTTWGFSVRCVLGLRWSSAAHTPVCSCATTM